MNKIKISFIAIFAALALFDLISTSLALSAGRVEETNPVGKYLLGVGGSGIASYLLCYAYLLFLCIMIVMGLDFIITMLGKININAAKAKFVYIPVSIFLSSIQINAIINNLYIAKLSGVI